MVANHLGKVAHIDSDLRMVFGGFMGVLRAKNIIISQYLFQILISPDFKKALGSLTDGLILII